MKVVAFNGSPHKEGNTFQALKMVGAELEKENIEVEIIHVGNQRLNGCLGCGGCARNRDEKCVIKNDSVNEWIQKIKEADGIIISSPVHFSALGGTIKCFLDRAFYVSSVNKSMFRHKVGASVVAVRRSGGVPTFDQLNNFLTYAEMLIPTSNYWNVVHGRAPGEVESDSEGVQIMSVLGKNMAWLLKLKEAGKEICPPPERTSKIYTSFVREDLTSK
ncbi:MAG: flavodoxin family protein [Lentisphaeria bacterium]